MTSDSPSRALILAGGGLKVAYQAGVMQVWLDEAGIEFDHVDGASGGLFNLSMLCQGMTGTEIADNWRDLPIWRGISPNWLQVWKGPFAASLMTYRRWRKNVMADHWGLDWDRIRNTGRSAAFNLYNFSTHQLEVWDAGDITEDAMISGVSLPMWFPPVRINGHDYIDAVYASDANLLDAVSRGADELWIIWTVSELSRWRNGFVHQYFQIIEAAANGRFRADLARIEANNAAIESGGEGEFGRTIDIRILRAEVPLHYILNFRSRRFTRAVELGVEHARLWCGRHGVGLSSAETAGTGAVPTYLEFTETMKGAVEAADSGATQELSVTLTIGIDDVDAFVRDPVHAARATGHVDCDWLGGRLAVDDGEFNLFVDQGPDPVHKRMIYRLPFTDRNGRRLVLNGFKEIHDDPGFDLWSDTTRLRTTIDIPPSDDDASAPPLATGEIRIHMLDFLKQLTTFRAKGPSVAAELAALGQFGKLFLGALWSVYAPIAKRSLHDE